jgi:hypothetical protein
MIGNGMIDGEFRFPDTNLHRAEEGSFSDQLDLGTDGESQVRKTLHDTVVTPDKRNGSLLPGLEGRDRDQMFIAAAGRIGSGFGKTGRATLHLPVTCFNKTPVRATGRGFEQFAECTFGLVR